MPLRLTFGLTVVVGMGMLAGACGGSSAVTEVSGPDAVRCQTALSAPPSTVPAAGNRVTLTVLAARECTWTASSDASWAPVSPSTGQGETSLTVTVAANPEGRTRTAVLSVNDNRLSLTQQAAPCRFQASPDTIRLSHLGGRASVELSTLIGCSWRAASNQPWARVLTENGTSSGTITIEVSRNDGAPRSATLTVANLSVTIDQDAAGAAAPPADPAPPGNPGPNPPPNPGNCVSALEPDSRSFGPAGTEEFAFLVVAAPGCAWNTGGTPGWITLMSASGTGTGPVRYRVAANTSPNERTGTISVSGRTHTVRQAGSPPSQPQTVEFRGTAANVSGSCPNRMFTARGFSVFTDNDTKWKGDKCRDLRNGADVKVEGRLLPDNRVLATKVDVDEDDD